ncbi:hypothetical protein M2281_004007 [Mesorhizobium soli]|uniref:hypothetical protein n=1 Tax=Pseudaminobacter soli (ex Li et al. 2025) TaxID=1295366 RepID=UPI0024765768|nr:hypothetical protein [Mesorhizobium soli]MDH6233396.1 hypothetical protein [Mesorhizobium soli]
MSKASLLSLVLVAPLLAAGTAHAKPAPKTLDLPSVSDVRIDSPAGELKLTTTSGEPNRATIEVREPGSGVTPSDKYFEDCMALVSANVEGKALVISIAPAPSSELANCSFKIDANVLPKGNVNIKQNALEATLDGDFGSVNTDTNAIRMQLDGHITQLGMKSQAVDTDLAYKRIDQNETISIDSKAINAAMDFGGAPISYSVEGIASAIDSELPNTPGAKPSIKLKAVSVHAVIR